MTLEQSPECQEEASQGRAGIREQQVKRPCDVSGLGAFEDGGVGGEKWVRERRMRGTEPGPGTE